MKYKKLWKEHCIILHKKEKRKMPILEQIALWCCTGFVIGELTWKVGYVIYILVQNRKIKKWKKEIKEDERTK